MTPIRSIHARTIFDSRGNPTVEVDVTLENGAFGRAAVPSGASTGSGEALELRDGDNARFGGKGTSRAVANVNETIAAALLGADASNQAAIDAQLCAIDGTATKSRLGANAILGVSMAVARAAAVARRDPLYRYLGGVEARLLPVPMFNVLNGGVHADNGLDVQEFMVVPLGAPTFADAVRAGVEVFHRLKADLKNDGLVTSVGDEGGFAPRLASNEDALQRVARAIEGAGYKPGHDVALAVDVAASEIYNATSNTYRWDGADLTGPELIELYAALVDRNPLVLIEDGAAEGDWNNWSAMTRRLGDRVQLVGGDIFVTNPAIIRRAVESGVANAALIKLNQIGTVTETLDAMAEARAGGYATVISHRSGETADDFIADFAVATRAGQIKTGAPSRGERLAKYNQLLRIEEELGTTARFAGRTPFARRATTTQ